MILSDSHMHTIFSTDSDTPVEKMIDGAIAKGLDQFALQIILIKTFLLIQNLGKMLFNLIWMNICIL